MAYSIDIERRPWGRATAFVITATSKRGEKYELRKWLWREKLAEQVAERIRIAQRSTWNGPKESLWKRVFPQRNSRRQVEIDM